MSVKEIQKVVDEWLIALRRVKTVQEEHDKVNAALRAEMDKAAGFEKKLKSLAQPVLTPDCPEKFVLVNKQGKDSALHFTLRDGAVSVRIVEVEK